jgi:predicted kinase
MSDTPAGIIAITGIMAAGKSTVAQALAERLPRSVHLRGDSFRRMIVNGQASMEPPLSAEAEAQLRLRYELAAMCAGQYHAAGFTVVYQDIILGPILADVANLLRQTAPTAMIVLTPSPDVVQAREAGRSKTGYAGWTPEDLHTGLHATTPRLGLWLDTSTYTVNETVDTILARLGEAML